MSKTNKVACFYTSLKNNEGTMAFTEQCYPMIDYWKKSWETNGWEAFVLSEEDIEKDEDYFTLKFDKFEESNLCKYTIDWDCEYSRSCYLRWLAYHQFAKKHGDIFWCDYDIINYGLSPYNRILPNHALIGCNSAGRMVDPFGQKIINTFIEVENEEYDFKTLAKIINFHDDRVKISDMFITQNLAKIRLSKPHLGRVANETIVGSQELPFLIHYHNGIYNKPRPKEKQLTDFSPLLFKPNDDKYSRLECIKILEKQHGLEHYG
jgi:hypothetical protein